MATTAEKGHFPQKKGPGIVLKTTAAIAGGVAIVGGTAATMDALNVGPFASSPNQGNHEDLPGSMPSATVTAARITESPTPISTPEPTPSIGFKTTETGITFTTEKGEVLNVPQIEGLKASLQTAENGQPKVIYTALEQNPYGISPEEYAGEYKPNVQVEQAQTGGVVLKAPVVLKLINDRLATTSEQKDKWIIPLPVDITNVQDPIIVGFTKKIINGGYEFPFISISLTQEANVVNIIPDSDTLHIARSFIENNWGYLDPFLLFGNNADEVIPGKEMRYIEVLFKDKTLTESSDIHTTFGDPIASTNAVLILYGATNKFVDLDFNTVLKVNETPVFLSANTPQ